MRRRPHPGSRRSPPPANLALRTRAAYEEMVRMAARGRRCVGCRRRRSLFQLGSAESSTASSNGSMTPASEAAHSLHTSRQVSNPQASISGVRLRWNSNCASHCGQMTTRAARTGTALSFVSTRSAEFAIMSTIAVGARTALWRCLYSRRSETLLAGDPSNFSDRVELRLTVSVRREPAMAIAVVRSAMRR